jgi:hypothetical protein
LTFWWYHLMKYVGNLRRWRSVFSMIPFTIDRLHSRHSLSSSLFIYDTFHSLLSILCISSTVLLFHSHWCIVLMIPMLFHSVFDTCYYSVFCLLMILVDAVIRYRCRCWPEVFIAVLIHYSVCAVTPDLQYTLLLKCITSNSEVSSDTILCVMKYSWLSLLWYSFISR